MMFSPQKTLLTTALLSSVLLSQGAIANTQKDCQASFDGVRLTVPCITSPNFESTFSATFILTGEDADIAFILSDLEETISEVSVNSLRGVFIRRGYGFLLEFGDGVFSVYDVNSQTCIQLEQDLPIEFFREEYPSILLQADGSSFDTLAKHDVTDVHNYTHERLEMLPPQCQQAITQPVSDFSTNFEALWHSFNDNYPFFTVKQVDWQEIYNDAKPLLSEVRSDEDLLELFGAMIRPLNDIHVDVVNTDAEMGVASYHKIPNWILRILETYRAEQGLTDLPSAFAAQQHQLDNFEEFVLDLLETDMGHQQFFADITNQAEQLIPQYVADLSCPVETVCTGSINPQIGYLSLRAMFGYAGEGIEDPELDIAFMQEFLDQFMLTLADKQAVIIDIRNNEGGFEAVSNTIAARFNPQPQVVYHKEAKFAGGFANQHPVILDGASQAFTKPVYVLINEETYSAAETFSLAMRNFPHVILIGEATQGGLSDKIERTLPNGWEFSVPSEVYSDVDGNEYEEIGVPADIESLFWLPADVQQGEDDAIEQALHLFSQG